MTEATFQQWTIPFVSSDFSWDEIEALQISEYPWYESGLKQGTAVKLAYNETHLLVQVQSEDVHSFADHTELNSQVCEDSCVEFFFSPRAERGTPYFNVEVNCIGTPHFAYGPGRAPRVKSQVEQAQTLEVQASEMGPLKVESDQDQSWEVSFKVSLEVLKQWSEEDLQFNGIWWANFYRCGGRVEPQYAAWNSIDNSEPDYHRPEQFGQLIFGPRS